MVEENKELALSNGGSLVPSSSKVRPACPFYGFCGMHGVMMDQEGNQCALINDSYSPCQMEVRREKPIWEKCSLNNKQSRSMIEKSLDSVRVFPKEFRPSEERGWQGISLKEWIGYVNQ